MSNAVGYAVKTTTTVTSSSSFTLRRSRCGASTHRRCAAASASANPSVEDADALSNACASVDSWAIRAARESDLDGIVRE